MEDGVTGLVAVFDEDILDDSLPPWVRIDELLLAEDDVVDGDEDCCCGGDGVEN